MKTGRPHKKLLVWQEAINLVKLNYALCKKLPDDEKFGIISQLKRASVSVPTNIAEGAARNTDKEFLHFLVIANGSLSEIDTLLTVIIELNYLTEAELAPHFEKLDRVSALLHGLSKSIKP